ncbi:hypothetical protein AX774_g5626 [Zancudomyces culisetae]|uniref:Uncharacterized protein n=1 Tax=Zancudomyces culisetae TaxID=1213189 RepID=A0A1R1PJ06_ZANCU|nr:hypothetical protein AX774_g5626 [Zancudomyces culisetae]|eukprot:OMH80928.1 hypothetical protein AX774_g5626 [Zancudomyces culisetae]
MVGYSIRYLLFALSVPSIPFETYSIISPSLLQRFVGSHFTPAKNFSSLASASSTLSNEVLFPLSADLVYFFASDETSVHCPIHLAVSILFARVDPL